VSTQDPARWYCVDSIGLATLCHDEADARRQAEERSRAWPAGMPCRAVLMGDVGRSRPAMSDPADRISADYIAAGWTFAYEPGTKFIGASHDRGGRQSIAEVVHPYQPHEFGEFLARALRGEVGGVGALGAERGWVAEQGERTAAVDRAERAELERDRLRAAVQEPGHDEN
jgi:hypothetical protein